MKKKSSCLIITVAILMSMLVVGCESKGTDGKQEKTAESTAYVKTSQEMLGNRGHGVEKTIFEYDSDGRLVKMETFYNDVLWSIDRYEYDKEGHMLTEYRRAYTIPEQEHKTVYEWRSVKSLPRISSIKTTHHYFEDNNTVNQTCSLDYNDQGLIIREDIDGNLQEYDYEKKKDADGVEKWFTYDSEDGNLIKYELYDNNEYKTISYYDSKGELDQRKEYHENGMPKSLYTYNDGHIDWYKENNERGAIVAEIFGNFEMKYNNEGVLTKIKDNAGGFDNKDYNRISEEKDDMGNVIKQEYEISNDDGDVSEITVTYQWKK